MANVPILDAIWGNQFTFCVLSLAQGSVMIGLYVGEGSGGQLTVKISELEALISLMFEHDSERACITVHIHNILLALLFRCYTIYHHTLTPFPQEQDRARHERAFSWVLDMSPHRLLGPTSSISITDRLIERYLRPAT